MNFLEIIEKKKHNKELTKEEINFWISSYVANQIPDYQVSALCMAIFFQGMNENETAWLCDAMMNSGKTYDLAKVGGIVADKHSTGGVGDKTSISLAPMVASCGLKVGMMSGRGLGHTGGTLDKLESIEGFNIHLSEDQYINQLKDIGIAIVGQTDDIVPADKKLYSLRDVTATVDASSLGIASIMSKKLACGANSILLDVKYGNGAFTKSTEEAEFFAEKMISIGRKLNRDTRAIISNMNQPLGKTIGNALEIKEAVELLLGKGEKDYKELCLTLGAIMLVQGKVTDNESDARIMLEENLQNGKAYQKFKEMVIAQGGNINQIEDLSLLPTSKYQIEMVSKTKGVVHSIRTLELARLSMGLGAGRQSKDDEIDLSVGLSLNKKVGDEVNIGDVLAVVHTNSLLTNEWINVFYQCYQIRNETIVEEPLIYKKIIS